MLLQYEKRSIYLYLVRYATLSSQVILIKLLIKTPILDSGVFANCRPISSFLYFKNSLKRGKVEWVWHKLSTVSCLFHLEKLCMLSFFPFLSIREKQRETEASVHWDTFNNTGGFGSSNGLVSHKLWTLYAEQSQRRYQSTVFALAQMQAASIQCRKHCSKLHTDGGPCLSVAQSLCLISELLFSHPPGRTSN